MTALALALSYIERFIPLELLVPLPGIKLGLANIVTLVVLTYFGPLPALAVVTARCALGALFSGSAVSLCYSFAGGWLALGAMTLAFRSRGLSVWGVSVCGSAAHVTGQILAASALLGSSAVFAYLPLLLLAGIPAGLLTGAVASASIRGLIAAAERPEPSRKG